MSEFSLIPKRSVKDFGSGLYGFPRELSLYIFAVYDLSPCCARLSVSLDISSPNQQLQFLLKDIAADTYLDKWGSSFKRCGVSCSSNATWIYRNTRYQA